ncbi:hypothetical protein J7T55_013097 [Diaporthe amygdali]|uniref:uncharacterized protein n=1 Tax=Phomopsis amygdali TaxID=1214568 RepID=UPI0022FEBBF2|nr:uncharacterized protein J7T55_013097 [Diaporthe amygdali]KAJ0118841.1 hypothetical protein J7T55_013097 [Diaporthe amygdali]
MGCSPGGLPPPAQAHYIPENWLLQFATPALAWADHDPDLDLNLVLEACIDLIVVQGRSTKSTKPISRSSHLSVQEYSSSHEWPDKPECQLLGAVCLHMVMSSGGLLGSDASRRHAQSTSSQAIVRDATRTQRGRGGLLISSEIGKQKENKQYVPRRSTVRTPA